MMRKSEYALWALLVLAVLAAGSTMVSLARSQSASAANSEIYRQLDLFGEVLERVRSDYVEKPDDSKLIEAAINGMLTALDPHSAYLNPKHFRDMQVQTRGEFGGLGIEVTMENGVVKVVSPIEDTPAAKAGIMSGDLITALDKEQIQGMVILLESVKGFVLVGPHDIGHILFCMDITDLRWCAALLDQVPDRLQQMRLPQSHATIDEQRVVCGSRVFRDLQSGRTGKLIRLARNERIESKAGIQAAAIA